MLCTPLKNQHDIGKSPCSIGNTSSFRTWVFLLVFWTARKQHDPSYLKPGNGITHHFAAEIPQQSDTYSDTFEPLRCCVAFFPGWLADLAVFASWNPEWNSLNSPKNTILSEKRNLLNTLMFFHIWRPFKGGIAQVEPWFLKIAQVVFVGQHIGDPLIPLLLKKHTQVWVFKVAVLIKCYPSENARFRMFWSQWEWGDINPDTHGNGKKDWGWKKNAIGHFRVVAYYKI